MLPGAQGMTGHMPLIREDRMRFLALGATSPDPLVRVSAPLGVVALITTPDLLHELLVVRHAEYVKSAMMRFTIAPIAGEGLFTTSGALWKRQRKLMAPLFQPSALHVYADAMLACTRRVVDGWADGQRVDLARETTRITMDIAARTLFDADTTAEAETLSDAITVALDWGSEAAGGALSLAHVVPSFLLARVADVLPGSMAETARAWSSRLEHPRFLPGAAGQRLRQAVKVLDDYVARMIAERRAQGSTRDDLLSRLLAARDDDGAAMSDTQVRDEVLTLFVAGHETTATGLAWAIDLLCRNPDWYARVEAEVDALGHRPGLDDLPRLQTVLRVFKEALRLYPPAYFFGRTTWQASSLGGYHMPRFGNVLVSPWVIHHNPRVWDDPERFDPDRFLPEAEVGRHRCAWIPFGAGPRVCIGLHFALMEAQLVLAEMLQRYHFDALEPSRPDPATTLRPAGTMPVRVTQRPGPGA